MTPATLSGDDTRSVVRPPTSQARNSSWSGSAWPSESTLHQLAPYIGKTKSTIASSLVRQYSKPGDVVCDPFAGCGTIAFEAWAAGRHVVANDLSPYGALLTRAKLDPYESLDAAMKDLKWATRRTETSARADLRKVPRWVRDFFHPETLRETLSWANVLREEKRWFLLACLMGILHHQRPGFLSYPSSHTVPYLRLKNFPRANYPELYEYRSVADRLRAKVTRAFRRVPNLDYALDRRCTSKPAENLLSLRRRVDAIVTSPPYMRQLDYGRDNRLRLWFLGCRDWWALDREISPRENAFLALMGRCFQRWAVALKEGGYCVLVIGDGCSREEHRGLARTVARIATEANGFELVAEREDEIPSERRVRRGLSGNTTETVLVLQRPAGAGARKRGAA